VAVHRWFARGEDWAVHPQLADQLPEIVSLLDDRLKAREMGPFRLALQGGEVLGEMQDDPHCLDSRAQARRPLIIRLAQVPGQLRPQQRESFLSALRGVPLPSMPGVDQGLIVSTEVTVEHPVPLLAKRITPSPTPSGKNRLLMSVLVLILIAGGGLVWMAMHRLNSRSSPGGGVSMPIEGNPVEPPASADALRALLRRYEAIDHPYVHFLLKYPDALTRSPQADEPRYDTWRAAQRREFTAASHPLPRKLRERVARWRELPPEFQALCLRLRELRLEIDPTSGPCPTPIEEIEAFFEMLTRPSGLPPREEFDHSANAFLARLPRDPYRAGQTYDRLDQVRETLRGFLNESLLTQPPLEVQASTGTLLSRLREELDYPRWREQQQGRGILFADENTSLEERLRQAIRRFRCPPR
jgi:hypothetical protein